MGKSSGLSFYEKEKKLNKEVVLKIIELVISTAVAIFLAFVITFVFGGRTSIIGDSMEPGISSMSQVLINRFVYIVSSPKKNDVIVFLPYGNTNTHYYVKRVVAIPGDTVQIIDGRLYINGYVAESDDLHDRMENPGIAETPVILGDGEYFVLGDNRNSSEDSRSGNIGPVRKDNIIGKAWLYLPDSKEEHIGLIQ